MVLFVVDEVTVPDGGFVTVHDVTVLDGGDDTFGSVRGTSGYIEPGTHEDVTVTLDEPLAEVGTVVAMANRDTDGDRNYRFASSNGEADGPYSADGEAVVDDAALTVESDGSPATGWTTGTWPRTTARASARSSRCWLSSGPFWSRGVGPDGVLGSWKPLSPTTPRKWLPPVMW